MVVECEGRILLEEVMCLCLEKEVLEGSLFEV